jgi:hypothetical protein
MFDRISLSLLRNQQNRWTQLSSEICICHVMFDPVMDLAFSSSKWPEYVKPNMLWNFPLRRDISSSDESRFRFLEIGRIAEENYKPIIIHFSCDVRSSHQSHFLFFGMSRRGEQNYPQKCSFVMWCSILWSIWLFCLRNNHITWSGLCWEILLCHAIFHHLINLALFSSKLAE